MNTTDDIFIFLNTNVRENRRGNQEFTIHRHGQHWAQNTQNKNTAVKNKEMSTVTATL